MWLVFHKVHTGVKSLPYEEFVRAALCFGWIDSLVTWFAVRWVHRRMIRNER